MSIALDHFSGSIVTDTGDLIISASSGFVRLIGGITSLEHASPQLRFIETDQTGANGKFRFYGNDNVFQLQRNTHVSDPFATAVTIFKIESGSNAVTFDFVPKVLGDDIYHAGNLSLSTITGTLSVAKGGTGVGTLTGYVKGAGTANFTASATIPEADIADGTIFPRLGATESITGAWTFSTAPKVGVNDVIHVGTIQSAISGLSPTLTGTWSFNRVNIAASPGPQLVVGSGGGISWSNTSGHFALARNLYVDTTDDSYKALFTSTAGYVALRMTSGAGGLYIAQDAVSVTANQVITPTWNMVLHTGNLESTLTASGFSPTVAGSWTFSAAGGVQIQGTTIRNWSSTDTDIDALIPGSTAGSIIEGWSTGHLVLGIRSNDANDGLYIIDKANTNSTYQTLLLSVSRALFQYQGSNIYHAGNFVAGTNYIAPGGTGSGAGLTALNASQLTTGTVPNARISGLYDGITVKLDGTNTIFGTTANNARTVYDLVQYRGNGSAIVGAVVFTAPNNSTTVMHQLVIRGYTYVSGSVFQLLDCTVCFYRTGATINSPFIVHRGNMLPLPSIRVGLNAAGNTVIIIGDVADSTPYPHYAIVMASFSHSGAVDTYCYGWTSSLVTSLTGYTALTADLSAGGATNTTTLQTWDTILFSGQATGANVDSISFDDGTNFFTLTADSSTSASGLSVGKLILNNGATDASLASTGHAFQIGAATGGNMIANYQEIMVRNNGVAASLYLNWDSTYALGTGVGRVNVGPAGLYSTGDILLSNAAPTITLQDTTASAYNGRLQVNANNLYFSTSTDDVTYTEVFRFELDTKFGYAGGKRIYVAAGGLSVAVADGGTGGTDAASGRTGLGLGTAAIRNTGTSGTAVPLLNAAATWSAAQDWTNHTTFNLGASAIFQVWDGPLGGSGVPVISAQHGNTYASFDSLTAYTFLDCGGTTTSNLLRLTSTSDVSLTSTNHALQIGDDFGAHLIMDNNELQALGYDAGNIAASLILNGSGGNVQVGSALSTVSVLGALKIGSTAAAITQLYVTQNVSLNFPSIAAGGRSALTITCTGVAVGDHVLMSFNSGSLPTSGVAFIAHVSATNTVAITAFNYTSAAVDAAAYAFNVMVFRVVG